MVLFTAAVLLDCGQTGAAGHGRRGIPHESRDGAGRSGWRDVSPQHLATTSGWRDLNPRPPAPKAGALPSCATPRGGTSVGASRETAAPAVVRRGSGHTVRPCRSAPTP